MPVIGATWAHGNAVVAQSPSGGALQDVDGVPWTGVVGHRLGWGATYKGVGDGQLRDTWFHIPIPSLTWLTAAPAIGRLFLDTIHLLFETRHCRVTSVQAWDNRNQFFVASRPTLAADEGMSGDWSDFDQSVTNDRGVILRNSWPIPGRHAMSFGLGLSVFVDFTGQPEDGTITFFAAGASWANRAAD
jgi:hypothetical protein